ncbi:MAG TPA: efflux RND transporter periplasmic adaptor subunit [Clostridiales bacterium]|nr:efflux RND transporter periplasmic adaptor subunit [Clostridiales bacterium]HPV00990.1 efflux RND transporter periplasmic adaptor subunit [Clostridiales bacterium]
MRKKVIIASILVISSAVLVTAGAMQAAGTAGSGAVSVQAAAVVKGDLSSWIYADGVVEETKKSEAYFDTPLKVTRVMITEGQRVKQGQQLIEVDMSEMYSRLETLKSNRRTQQIALDSKAGDAEVQRALNSLKAAERNYNDAKKAYEDNKALYEASAISKAEMEMSEKQFREAESAIENARLAYEAAVESRNNSRKTAEENIKVTDLQISDLEKKINDINEMCMAAMEGVVAAVNVQEGAYTGSMQPAYRIIDPDKLRIRARVNEYDIKNVAVGQKARVTGDAIDKNTEITGTVESISPVATTAVTSGGSETVVEIIIGVDDSKGVLKPGLNVTCEIITVDKNGVLLAPMEAIKPDRDDNLMVFVIDTETNRIEQRRIEAGINSDMSVEILDGLEEGELVVIDPQPSYSDGMKVRVKQQY